LVSDDVVDVANEHSELVARTVRNLSYHVHVRDIGIIDVEEIYGSESVQAEVPLLLRVELVRPSGDEDVALGDEDMRCDILGVSLPDFKIRTFSSRNLALVIEIAVRNELARRRDQSVSRNFANCQLRLVISKD
jgi:HPr kinase/phosphorylase